MAGAYTARLVPSRNHFSSDSIADGNYDFDIGEYSPNPNTVVDYIYCVDADGNPVVATAGSFTVFGSPDGGKSFDALLTNAVSASSALSTSRTKPSGRGVLNTLRVTTEGLAAAGAVGFVVGISQAV